MNPEPTTTELDVAVKPWEVPAPLLEMLVQHSRWARPHTQVRLRVIDRAADGGTREGFIEVNAGEVKRWLAAGRQEPCSATLTAPIAETGTVVTRLCVRPAGHYTGPPPGAELPPGGWDTSASWHLDHKDLTGTDYATEWNDVADGAVPAEGTS